MKSRDYVEAMNNLKTPNGMQNRIYARVLQKKYVKGNKIMLKKKIFAITAAAVVALGSIGYAVGSAVTSWYSSSSADAEYKTLPTAEQCVKDCGYEPLLIDEFENGYKFKDGSIVKNRMEDDAGSAIENFKSFDFRYAKNGDEVYFTQKKYTSQTDEPGSVTATADGTDIYYYSYKNKVVPPDYKLTKEDQEAEKNGELVFSYGSDKVEINVVSSVSWDVGDMHYTLMQIDGKLSEKELADMALEALKK